MMTFWRDARPARAATLPVLGAGLLLGGLLLWSGCAAGTGGWQTLAPAPAASALLHITGTIQFLDLEGGMFVIRDAQGTRFSPTNLPRDFRADGVNVEVEARRRDDLVSVGMTGPLVEIVRIRRVPRP
jgi:hypothetical protein